MLTSCAVGGSELNSVIGNVYSVTGAVGQRRGVVTRKLGEVEPGVHGDVVLGATSQQVA